MLIFFGKRLICVLVAAVILTGCSAIQRRLNPSLHHQVKYRGETLSLVSAWYTGNSKNSTKIQRFNGLKTSKLRLGQDLYIPRSIVKRSKQMPESYLSSEFSRKKTRNNLREIAKSTNASSGQQSEKIKMVPSNLVAGNGKSGGTNYLSESKHNPWIREELDRDSLHEEIIKRYR